MIDVGQMVDMPAVKKWFELKCTNAAVMSMCRLECTFMIYDVNGPGPTLQDAKNAGFGDLEAEEESAAQEKEES